MEPSPTFLESRVALYDALVDWPKRLATETPFYRKLFAEVGARRVLDAACGTGRHAAMFHAWGLEVEGADLSADMIAASRAQFGDPAGLRWVQRSFDAPPATPGTFDVALCIGNSLALAPDMDTVQRAVRAMLSALRPGGACVIQVLNLWRLADGPTIWQKYTRATLKGDEHILLKAVHRAGDRGFIDIVDLQCAGGASEPVFETATFLGVEADCLEAFAREAGATKIELLGSLRSDPYDRGTSGDLIMLCRAG